MGLEPALGPALEPALGPSAEQRTLQSRSGLRVSCWDDDYPNWLLWLGDSRWSWAQPHVCVVPAPGCDPAGINWGSLEPGGRPGARLCLPVPLPRCVSTRGGNGAPGGIYATHPLASPSPSSQGPSAASSQPPLSVEFCGSIFVDINITLGWVGLLLIIFMILL